VAPIAMVESGARHKNLIVRQWYERPRIDQGHVPNRTRSSPPRSLSHTSPFPCVDLVFRFFIVFLFALKECGVRAVVVRRVHKVVQEIGGLLAYDAGGDDEVSRAIGEIRRRALGGRSPAESWSRAGVALRCSCARGRHGLVY
jgi:hypothetical protein